MLSLQLDTGPLPLQCGPAFPSPCVPGLKPSELETPGVTSPTARIRACFARSPGQARGTGRQELASPMAGSARQAWASGLQPSQRRPGPHLPLRSSLTESRVLLSAVLFDSPDPFLSN